MQNGRISRFLKRCVRLEQCFFDQEKCRYVFCLHKEISEAEETIFVYPKQRQIGFRVTREVYRGETADPNGFGYFDNYDTIVVESVDQRGLSSAQAAKVLCDLFAKHDSAHVVSKRSLKLLR